MRGSVGGEDPVHYLSGGDGFTAVLICQLIKLYILYMWSVLCVSYTSIKLLEKNVLWHLPQYNQLIVLYLSVTANCKLQEDRLSWFPSVFSVPSL